MLVEDTVHSTVDRAPLINVPDDEVAGQEFTHHQLLQDYERPLGDGNNMFVSVSARGDAESAPPGERAVMISTHTPVRSPAAGFRTPAAAAPAPNWTTDMPRRRASPALRREHQE